MNEYQTIWNQMLSLLREDLPTDHFENVFKDIIEVYKFEKGYIYVVVPNPMTKFRIESYYMQKIKDNIPKITHEKIGFKFILEKDIELMKEKEKKEKIIEVDKKYVGRNLSSLCRFENFVTGESNRMAYITALNVASGGTKVNPLYIFGEVGLGKTHLMTSIGNYLLDNDINTKVLYTSSQLFTEDFVMSTSYKGSLEKSEAFYKKYFDIDLLLVDDIQFLEGKTATQEEFFKIFENLTSASKQIIITSDRKPIELKNIMQRLKSRFGWGVTVEIKKPDQELLINILKRKLEFLISEPKDVSDDVLKVLSSYFPNNIRDLEGALRTFVNYCICMNCPFTIDNLHLSLENLIPKNEIDVDKSKETIEVVTEVICDYFKVTKKDLLSTSRKQQITYARQFLMYFLRTTYNLPLQSIGYNLGNRDHTTVSHGVDKITQQIITTPATKSDCDIILGLLNKKKQ